MNPLHHRGASRSATATPTGSPKRRLPQIPIGASQTTPRDRVRKINRIRVDPRRHELKHRIFSYKIHSRDRREYLANFPYLLQAIFHTKARLRLPKKLSSLWARLSSPRLVTKNPVLSTNTLNDSFPDVCLLRSTQV